MRKRINPMILIFLLMIIISPHTVTHKPFMYAVPESMFDAAPLAVAPLDHIIGDAQTDEDASAAIVAYYETNREALAVTFGEDQDQRLRGLFGMYVTHVAVPYGEPSRRPSSLREYVESVWAFCGIYAEAQARIYSALGLAWRIISIDEGWHGITEALIDRRYESFDSTSNVWVDISVGEMIAGVPRGYRNLYTPINDVTADDRWRAHLLAGYNVGALRDGLPLWGISVFPSRWSVMAQG